MTRPREAHAFAHPEPAKRCEQHADNKQSDSRLRIDPQHQLAAMCAVEPAVQHHGGILPAVRDRLLGLQLAFAEPAAERLHRFAGLGVVEYQEATSAALLALLAREIDPDDRLTLATDMRSGEAPADVDLLGFLYAGLDGKPAP